MKPLLRTYARIVLLLALPLFAIACDTATSADVPTATVVAAMPSAKPLSGKPSQSAEPVSQGWIIELSSLPKENHYRLNFDVLGSGGWPVGTLTVARGQSYEQQGKPDLISTIKITTVLTNSADNPILEIGASQPGDHVAGSTPVEAAQAGHTYEKTTAEGWRVRTTVRALTVDSSPKLSDGTIGQIPVFSTLDLDVEVTGSEAAPYLGMTADNVIRSRAAAENLRGPDLQLLDHGVVVREVLPGGPAAKAGLQKGDVILAFDGQNIDELTPLSVVMSHYKVGDKATLEVVRDTKTLQVVATLQRRP